MCHTSHVRCHMPTLSYWLLISSISPVAAFMLPPLTGPTPPIMSCQINDWHSAYLHPSWEGQNVHSALFNQIIIYNYNKPMQIYKTIILLFLFIFSSHTLWINHESSNIVKQRFIRVTKLIALDSKVHIFSRHRAVLQTPLLITD